ncbi:YveK family protein [Paenibacillus xylaniclasticus]|uniref:YveK family protein n=1 Tax=Paenibacillus xylaniclasticus TaxID=588083 RepID=UPI0013DE8A8E|nr:MULTISPECIES: Wzz/FepE/Etk N-terminal domain-containing protein [Paenibacillus]GFN32780.1 exopolysaccharide biosynthesis protein [Paenibacillus curdlanolyticus]
MSEELDLRDYAVMLRRRWRLIVMIVMVCCCAVFGFERYLHTPIYEATAKLIMANANSGDSGEPLHLTIEANLKMLQTYKDLITTPPILKKAAAEHPELGISAVEMAGRLNVSVSSTSQVLTLSARDANYESAAILVNAVAESLAAETAALYGNDNLKVLYEAEVKPDTPPSPVNINLKKMLLIGFIISLMFAAGVCLLLEYLDKRIWTERDVRRSFGLDTLVELPMFVDDGKEGHRRSTRLTLGRAGENNHVPVEK